MRIARRTAIASAATVAAFALVMAEPATADSYAWSTSGNARVHFVSYGDAINVCDVESDGRGAFGKLTWWNGYTWQLGASAWDRNGSGNSCAADAAREAVPEGVRVQVYACDTQNGSFVSGTCGSVYDWT